MPYQNIDVTVSPADLQAVRDAFAVVLTKLPFLINLTTEERKSMAKLGPNSLSFVQNAQTAVVSKPGVFPSSFDVAGFQKTSTSSPS